MADYIIKSLPVDTGDGRIAFNIIMRDTVGGVLAYKVVAVLAPGDTADLNAYVVANFGALWADPTAVESDLGAWINAEKAPFVAYYLGAMVAAYSALMAGDPLSVASGAASTVIAQNPDQSAEYQKVRDAMIGASDQELRVFLAQSVFVITGVLAGLRSR